MPIWEIKGTSFFVDVEAALLRQVDDVSNVIDIYEMKDEGTHYSFPWDGERKNIVLYTAEGAYPIVQLPPMAAIDPVGMRKKYSLKPGQLLPKRDADFKCDPDLLRRRIQEGRQPIVDILGKKYYVVWLLKQLCAHVPFDEPFLPSIVSLRRLAFYDYQYFFPKGSSDVENRDIFRFLYDKKKRKGVVFDGHAQSYSKNVVVLQIPYAKALDPVSEARRKYLDPTSFVDKYPLKKKHVARVIPWEKTRFSELFRVNLQKERERQERRRRLKL